jgi:lipopolysaccharide/colanic/teichoic acid biosynthesis glycosyltransferase
MKTVKPISPASKHPIQRAIAFVMLVALLPVFAVLFVFVKLDTRGPFIFKQKRPGYMGQTFTAFKIRSMSMGSERTTRLGVTQSDPLITRVGWILRATKLDEIPQLMNIIKGEMCFVGPRPIPVALDRELRSLIPGFELRYTVPPGITSLAQICVNDNGLNEHLEHDWRDRFEAEVHYTRMRCAWYDLCVIAMTVMYIIRKVVLR